MHATSRSACSVSYQQLPSHSSPTRGRETPNAALNLKRRYLWVSGRIIGDFWPVPPRWYQSRTFKQARGNKLYDFAGSTGLINGVPTTAGSFTFTVQVKDETRAADTETFTIEIVPPEAPTITTEALSSGTVGEFYCCGNLFASGGVQPYTRTVVAGTPPPGLTLPKRENTTSGTPTTARTFTFTVHVTDDLDAFSEKELSITIS
jgi:Putative Ig domain